MIEPSAPDPIWYFLFMFTNLLLVGLIPLGLILFTIIVKWKESDKDK